MKPRLIVALDVDSQKRAQELVDVLVPDVKFFKVGSVLFTRCGPSIVEYIQEKNRFVFLDLKWHDIPNTVQYAVESGTNLSWDMVAGSDTPRGIIDKLNDTTRGGVFMMTVHAQGGRKMLEAAIRGAKEKAEEMSILRPFIVGVTVLTSETSDEKIVLERAKNAQEAGLDGVVCSVHEARTVRKQCGEDFLIVTPGIRPRGYKTDDQSRVATLDDAVQANVDFIVVGRPIIEAKDIKAAAQQFQTKTESQK